MGGLFGESTAGGVQPYKYNGKELDRMHGLDLFDYGARHYDAAIGRWMSIDPLAEKYYSISNYAYCANNPVRFVDPTGNFITDFLNAETNEHIYVNDGKNQVLQITNADYERLKSINFDPNHVDYNNIVSRGSLREDLFYTIENVLSDNKFVSYASTGDCFKSAIKQNNVTPLGRDQSIDVFTKNGENYTSEQFNDGVNYLKSQLALGNSIVVGAHTGAKHNNANILTGHFFNVVGMGFDEKGNYFSYYDNANSKIGANIKENRLYQGRVGNNSVFYDNTKLGVLGVSQYILTEIRRNSKK